MEEDKNQKEMVPPHGLRRSARLGAIPPPSPPRRNGGSASDRKRPRLQKEDEGPPPRNEVTASVGDDVNVSVQGSPRKVEVSIVSGDDGGRESSENGSGGQRALSCRQPLPLGLGNEAAQSKVGGSISKLGGSSSSSVSTLVLRSAAARRSEVKSTAEEEEAHPCLFIENVLEVVFNHILNQPGPRTVISTDVRNIRLVCKTWATSMTRLYRQTRPKIAIYSYEQQRYNWGNAPELHSLTQFMKTMSSSPMIPAQKYSLDRGREAIIFRRKNLKRFREFLLICGPEMVELSMSIMARDAEGIMLNLEDLQNLELGKLKTLNLRMYEVHPSHRSQNKLEDRGGLMKFVELLLIAAKSLREVKLDYRSYTCSDLHRSQGDLVIEKLSLLLAKSMPKTVQRRKLSMRMNEAAFNNLAEMQVNLEGFELGGGDGSGSKLESRTMYKFLQSQATSLKDLQLWSPVDAKLIVEFPGLDELTNLKLADSTVSVTAPSHFGETFPKLRSLKMDTKNSISTLLSTVQKPSGSLKVLDLGEWRCPASIIKTVAQSFPYLAELRIGVHREHKGTAREVFTYLDNLESLHMSFFGFYENGSWADSLLSGMPRADCSRIRRLQDFGAVNENQLRRYPSMVNLTNLRKLVINENSGSRSTSFTDVSAHFVFLEMDSLREINLANSAVQFSPRYLDLLRNKLVLR